MTLPVCSKDYFAIRVLKDLIKSIFVNFSYFKQLAIAPLETGDLFSFFTGDSLRNRE